MSYTREELLAIGFASVGEEVRVSRKASFYGARYISLGNHCRIDDFCILSAGEGGIVVGQYVHIACYTSLIGKAKIELEDFANISGRVSIYSSNDDYSGHYLTSPQVDPAFTNVQYAPVVVGRHVIIGAGSVVIPGVRIGKGSAIGSLSFVNKDIGEFEIHVGVPARYVKERSRDLLRLEVQFLGGK